MGCGTFEGYRISRSNTSVTSEPKTDFSKRGITARRALATAGPPAELCLPAVCLPVPSLENHVKARDIGFTEVLFWQELARAAVDQHISTYAGHVPSNSACFCLACGRRHAAVLRQSIMPENDLEKLSVVISLQARAGPSRCPSRIYEAA